MFFATPHRGTDVRVWMMEDITGKCKLNTKPMGNIVQDIQTNSKILMRISQDFCYIINDYDIVTFYEEDKMEWLDSVVSI